MKNKTNMFLVMGYANTGSATLTFPEDFEFCCLCPTQELAQEHVDALNKAEGVEFDENGDMEDEDFDGTVYEFMAIPVVTTSPK